jgi:integrating conjugative element relaxase (TIGR03760 family)
MLKRLTQSLFGGGQSAARQAPPSPAPVTAPSSAPLPGGFQPVLPVDGLVCGEHRRRSLQQIAQTCSMPAALYDTLCYRPLIGLLLQVQQVPAADSGPWARHGGFGDLTLQYSACAVRLAKGHMFPPGAAPEEQAAQSAVWQAVVFWSALFHHLPLLARLEGEQQSGDAWLPGFTLPQKAYRCRFRAAPPSGAEASAQAALMAAQMLPAEAVNWLSGTPRALHNLAGALWNGHTEMPLIREILKQAAEKVGAPSMVVTVPASPVAPPAAAPIVATLTPAITPDSTVPSQPALEILLSELASSMPLPGTTPASAVESVIATVDSESVADTDITAQPLPGELPAPSDETDMLLSLFSMVSEPCVEEIAPVPDHADVVDVLPVDDAIPLAVIPDIVQSADDCLIAGDEDGDRMPELPVSEPPVDAEVASIAGMAGMLVPEKSVDTGSVLTEHPAPEPVARQPALTDNNGAGGTLPEGEAFLQWLKTSLNEGSQPVNGLQDKVHIVAGHVFLPVPGIFFEYVKQTGKEVTERERIQREFEQLNICKRRENKRYWFAHLQQDEQGQCGYQKRKGYLVKGRQLFGQMPQDSSYLTFP